MTPLKTERRVSLPDTMRKMAQRMDTLLEDHSRGNPNSKAAISQELRFWIMVDPLLAELHKQLVDAKAHHARLIRQRGMKDTMTEIAADMVDSAQGSVETRMIELRRSEETKAVVMAMVRKAQEEEQCALTEEARQKSKAFWQEFSAPQSMRPAHKQAGDSFFLVMASLMALQQNLSTANRLLSIAAVFDRASNDDRHFRRRLAGSA